MTTDTMTDIDRDVFRVAARSNDAHAAITRLTDDATAAMMAHVDMARADVVRLTKELADALEELQRRKKSDEVFIVEVDGAAHFTPDLTAAALLDEALGLRGELSKERGRIDSAVVALTAIVAPDKFHTDTLLACVEAVGALVAARPDSGIIAENARLTVEADTLRAALKLSEEDIAAANREIERLKEGEEHLVAGAAALLVDSIATEAATKKPRKVKEPVDLGPGPFVIMRNDAHGRRFWGYLDVDAGIECGWLMLDGAREFIGATAAEVSKPNRSKVVGLDEARRLLADDERSAEDKEARAEHAADVALSIQRAGGDVVSASVVDGVVVVADEPEACVLCDKVRCGCTVEIGPAIDDRDTVTTDDRVEEPADDAAEVETVDADDDSWTR